MFPEAKKKKIGGEEEEEDILLLSIDDFERRGIKIDDEKTQNLTGFEALLVVTEVASQKLVEEEEFRRKKMKERISSQEEKTLKKPKKQRHALDLNKNPQELEEVKQIKKQKRSSSGPEQTPDMPENMRNLIESINGKNVKLVIQKSLFHSDTVSHYRRMSIPVKQIRSEFLTQKEKESLEQGDWMKLVFVEPSLAVSEMVLIIWRVKKAGDDEKKKKKRPMYVLTTDWNKVRMANDLKEGDKVQLWSFRIQQQLCLALVRLCQAGDTNNVARSPQLSR